MQTTKMLKYNPDTLLNYATQAYGDYVKSQCEQWMPLIYDDAPKTEETVDIEHVKKVCDRLRNMLACVLISSQAANDVTTKLLRHVDRVFEICSGRNKSDYDNRILSDIANVLIHPAVTELDFHTTYQYTFMLFRQCHATWNVMHRYLYNSLSHLRMLKVVFIRDNYSFIKSVNQSNFLPQNIQELTLSTIDNEELEEISDSLRNLKKLHISVCELDNEGVRLFLKFTQLEDLTLIFTEMTIRFVTKLLEGLRKNKDASGTPVLKKFGCDSLTEHLLDTLVHDFHLVSLHLVGEPQNMSPLQYSSHLRSLSIEGIPFSSIESVLPSVGHQLSHLHLYPYGPLDLIVVAECCPVLVSLQVTCDSDMINDSDVLLPSFSNLKVVDLELFDCPTILTCILRNCTNLKVLKVKALPRGQEINIADVLQRNPLKHIEKLYWWSKSTSNMGMQVLQHCQINNSYFWRSELVNFTRGFFRGYDISYMYAVRLSESHQ